MAWYPYKSNLAVYGWIMFIISVKRFGRLAERPNEKYMTELKESVNIANLLAQVFAPIG